MRGAYLGLTSVTIDGSLSALNLPVKDGALVQSVEKGTAAEKAGIHGGNVTGNTEGGEVAIGGDIIVKFDGKTVTSSEDLANDVDAKQPGDTVSIELLRAERQRQLRTQDGIRDARHQAELRAEPEHARRLARETDGRGSSGVPRGHCPLTGRRAGGARYRWGMPETHQRASEPSPRVKICGITDLADAELAVELGAWAIGMVFYEGSPRRCSIEQAQRIAAALQRRVELCGVFVNAPLEQVVRTSEDLGLTMVQLHGDEGPAFCGEVPRRTGARVIKAAQVAGPGDVRDLERYHVDFHLLDARARARGEAGSARRHGRDVRLDAARRPARHDAADPQRRTERRTMWPARRAGTSIRGRQRQRHRARAGTQGSRRGCARSSTP